MAVGFILGRAGTGKTEHCFRAMEQWVAARRLGAKVFCIVPNQATFMAERQLAARDPGRSLLGVRVVSFDTLAREVAGGAVAESAIVNSRDRGLLVAMAIQKCASEFQFFAGAQFQPHLPGKIEKALTEIEQAGQDVAGLMAQCPGDSPTGRKLHDLQLAGQQYHDLLTGDRLDSNRQQQRLLDAIGTSPLLRDALVVVDGFAGFSTIQRRILVALARRVARMDIAILIDDPKAAGADEMDLYHRTGETLSRLRADFAEASIAVGETRLAPEGHRFRDASLGQLERALAGDAVSSDASLRPITLIEATSELEEVKAAARQIRKWLREDGRRLREIGVLCRNLSTYAPWVRPVFAEHGIEFFLDQRRGLSHHPLVRYLRSMLDIAVRGQKQQLVLDFLKCGLVPLEADELDLLENFVLRHGITGEGWQGDWDFLSCPASEDDAPDVVRERREAQLCDEYRRRALPPLDAMRQMSASGERTVGAFVVEIEALLSPKDSYAVGTLRRWIEQADPEEAQEHEQCLSQLQELLGSMGHLLGQQKVSFAQFASILLGAMENLEARLTPPTLDQVVVGQVDRSRSPEYRCVILLGLNDGTFPAGFVEDSIFSDNERSHLRSKGIELEPGSQRKTLDERLLAYVALTRASHELVICRPVADEDGRERAPSGIISAVISAVGVKKANAGGNTLAEAMTPAQLAGIVGAWRRSSAGRRDPSMEAAYGFVRSTTAPEPVKSAWNIVHAALSYANSPKLEAGAAKSLLREIPLFSVTRLEHFTACPFRHFASDLLRLEPRDVAEVSALDLGNAFHGVLDQLGKQIIDEKLDWSRGAFEKRLNEMLESVAKELHNEVLLSSARNQYLVSVVRRMLDRVVDDQEKLQAAGRYRLHSTERSFGREGDELKALELVTPAGRTVRICGRIDRIDKDALRESYLVFDYKRQGKQLKLAEAQCGLTLQLLTYLLVLRDNGLRAEGSLYIPLMHKMKAGARPTDGEAPEGIEEKPRGIFSWSALEGMEPGLAGQSKLYGTRVKKDGRLGVGDGVDDESFEKLLDGVRTMLAMIADKILDGVIAVSPYQLGKTSPCPNCDFRAVCRMDTATNGYRQPVPYVELCRIRKGGDADA